MTRSFRIFLPIVVLLISAAVSLYLLRTSPEQERRTPKPVVPVVEVIEVQPRDYPVKVITRGTVAPKTQSTLVSEVTGRIIFVAANFRNGGFFVKDETVLRIDPAEYQLEVANLEASLQGVEGRIVELEVTTKNLNRSLSIEKLQLELAEKQFGRQVGLRKQGTVAQTTLEESEREFLLRQASVQNLKNSLTLIPSQTQTLVSELKLKQAQLDSARLNLERTEIKAPYSGRVLEKQADLGQSLSKGSVLASIYAIDIVEVRLPITDQQASFLELPEVYTDGSSNAVAPDVILFAAIAGKRYQWRGKILRTEGAIDSRTRQLFVVAEVESPYARSTDGRSPLMIGQFVEAEIVGRTLSQVYVLPRQAVRANDEVLNVTTDGRLERRRLDVVWRDREDVVARAGLRAGDRVSLTALPYTPEGERVEIKGAGRSVVDPSQVAGKN